jgi:tetratricopeptide (TPR) repeat protein
VVQKLWAEISYFNGLGAFMMGPATAAINADTEMKVSLPAYAYYLRGQALGLEAFGHQMSGNIKQGVDLTKRALRTGDWPVKSLVKAFYNLTLLHFMEADLSSAQIMADKSIQLALKHNLDASDSRYFAGMTFYLQNDLASAEAHFLPVIAHPARVDPITLIQSVCALMRLYYAQGKVDRAGAIKQQTLSQLEELDNAFSRQLFDMF